MDMLATPARALPVCAPRHLQVWQPPNGNAWPSPLPKADASVRTSGDDEDEEEMDEEDTADESGSAHDADEHISVKEEAAQRALRAMASAAHRSLDGAPPQRLRTRSVAAMERNDGVKAETTGAEVKPKKKRQFKKRKPTHTVRKEEKQALLSEIEVLQTKLDELKFQALVEQGETAKSVARQRQANMVLRESIEEHHVAFARVQSLLSGYVQQNISRVYPTKTPIVLGRDRAERHRTLMAMKGAKIREAWRFMTERCRHLDPHAAFYEEERFNSTEGDYCITRLDVVPLSGVPSIQAIFNALQRSIANAEIIISEISGNITIREDDDHGETSLMQARLVSKNADGSLIESNSVMFSEHFAEEDQAIIVGDYVDEDEVYPYRPHERIRRDGTSIMTVTPLYVDRCVNPPRAGEVHFGAGSGRDADGKELVVILKRWAAWKFHHTDIPVAGDTIHRLRDNMGRWGEIMLDSIRQTLAYSTRNGEACGH